MANRVKHGGRAAGTPNKVTRDARRAVATLVDENTDRLSEWLDTVAYGVKDEAGRYIVPPNPGKAFQLLTTVMEYAIPKLGRMEVVGDNESPVEINTNVTVFNELLKAMKQKRQLEP